jgi:poly(3-hydroxybutyrate) depolymerase
MTTIAPHIRLRRTLLFVTAALAVAALAATASGGAAGRSAPPQLFTITYTAHNGAEREATVLLPARYSPGTPLPLVISPHGRGGNGRANAKLWGNMPTVGNFAVVNPDGMGRRLGPFSFGYKGQIDDLARMPQIVAKALPWVRIDPTRIFALGSSMGGQETLLLVARHPQLLAGAAAMDSVTDLALRYRQILKLPSSPTFVKRWGAPKSICVRSSMRREVGATPAESPAAYAARSPLDLAKAIADSGVPLQIWWSRVDKIVAGQNTQSEALYRKLVKLGTRAPLEAYVGRWAHSTEMRSTALLPLALIDFGLLPQGFMTCPPTVSQSV